MPECRDSWTVTTYHFDVKSTFINGCRHRVIGASFFTRYHYATRSFAQLNAALQHVN